MPMHTRQAVALLLLFAAVPVSSAAQSSVAVASDTERIRGLQAQFERFREELRIPGMSVIVLREKRVVWRSGFGYADDDLKRPYTPDTPQHIASLTKTFAATLVMKLVEDGKLNLDEAVADYVPDVQDRRVRIKHLLSHTSGGVPGDQYEYDGGRYDLLTAVLEKKTGKPFRQLLVETFIRPLGMYETAPGQDLLQDRESLTPTLGQGDIDHYKRVLGRIALPYALYGEEIIPTAFPPQEIGAAAGLVSTVNDLAKFDVAIDEHRFLKPETQALAWTPFVSNSGKTLPHGLGWFAETFAGEKLIWHYGHWPGMYSATYIKVPAKGLTMILLANSEAASAGFYFTGGIETSVFACTFLQTFAWAGDDHGCRSTSDAAMRRWIADKRAEIRQPVAVSPTVLQQYAGDYKLGSGVVTVENRGRRLFINLPRKFPSELFPESATRFFLKTVDYEVVFVPGEQGKTIRLYVYTPGDRHVAERVQ
jgi:CubicO group peptidase (beta-lactamase class C family)